MAKQSANKPKKSTKPFLTDVKTLRDRARKNIGSGAVTFTYKGNAQRTIDILQSVLATEIVACCAIPACGGRHGISSEGVKAEFAQRQGGSRPHESGRERINQWAEHPTSIGGLNTAPRRNTAARAAIEMIKENLIAERIAVDHYRELVRYFGNNDPGRAACWKAY